MATIEQFLRTGELGPIRFGMTEDEIASKLGSPSFWNNSPDWLIKSFGALHLTFGRFGIDSKHRLAQIDLYFEPFRGGIPEQIRLTGWLPTDAVTEDEFTEYVKSIGLPVKTRFPGESGVNLFLPSGARATFSEGRLHSLHFPAPRTPFKQISFTVPADTFDTLRERAEKSNRSVSALCADWVTEKASSFVGRVG
jgi:hypothetical protein